MAMLTAALREKARTLWIPVEAEQNGLTLFFSITLTICSRRWGGWFISRQHIHHTNELSAKYTRWPKRIKMKKLNEK
ncbi:hypothetical protein FML29_24315 [Klebsiella oxytoca]|nr:hypothetical protein [Klebsiella oxytoca]MBZ7723920.1 hypothetical protein [Klebsiella oxytoca]TGN37749.1 hypothetical protein E5Q62_27640 [Klebsiella oxytoca]